MQQARNSLYAVIQAFIILCVLSGSSIILSQEESTGTNIIYPLLKPPYQNVVNVVVDGIESIVKKPSRKPYDDLPDLVPDGIVLTNRTQRSLIEQEGTLERAVLGLGEFDSEKELYSVSLNIDLQSLLNTVALLKSEVDKVVVFDVGIGGDASVGGAMFSGKAISIEHAYATDAASALRVFAAHNVEATENTAFIFRRGFIEINRSALLDAIIQRSWESRAITVGTQIAYAREGFTLALLPNFYEYGRQIGALWNDAVNEDFKSPRQEHVLEVLVAVNTRAAQRAGIFVNSEMLSKFDFSFPAE